MQQLPKPIHPTSERQPSKHVGKFSKIHHVCRSCRRLRSFDLPASSRTQDQKIAAFGSSYRGWVT
ncbi:hypothetical protein F7R14_01210 [Pseudomonas lini]|uniref:Uncharacterized protein n=1 Tax=Pseudomonas lini TaxID=163011 RepID=A0A7V7TNK5_9PSED|nr:hypothetical protein F7R14_01210 [Pseudomonas lini]